MLCWGMDWVFIFIEWLALIGLVVVVMYVLALLIRVALGRI